jgi:PAS domain S-box-containing protein
VSSLNERKAQGYRLLIDAVQDYAIFMLDPDGHVVSWNTGARKIKGYEKDEILGRHFSTFYPPAAVAAGWPDHELAVARAEGRFEEEGWRVRRDGSTFWASVVITALREPDGTLVGFAKVTRDLTERRRIEESLRQSEERLRLMIESVQDYAIFMLDPQGIVASWNLGAQRIKGYAASEIIGRHFSTFYPPEEVIAGKPELELRMARELGRFAEAGWRLRKDGTRFWANVTLTAFHDRAGQLIGFVKVTRDETDRRNAEQLEDAARRMEEFLAILAHELRNPLAPILNATAIMRIRTIEDPDLAWARDVIDRQTKHLTRLVDDLLDVGRITTGKIVLAHDRVDLADVLRHAVEATQPLLDARSHRIELVLPAEPLVVQGDPVRLVQVANNLLNNAAKFTPEGGTIHLGAERRDHEAWIVVRDSGVGIPADLLPTVFDLFRQGGDANEPGQGGLGIGLTLVRRLVEMHGGAVDASSEGAGKGSTFVVRLPLASPPASGVESTAGS